MVDLKKFRKKTGLTQEQIATALNISKPGYVSWETGRTQPGVDMLIKLADFFHVTIDNLLGHEVPYLLDKSTLSQNQKNIVNLLPYMSDNVCNMAEAYISGLIAGEQEHEAILQRFKK